MKNVFKFSNSHLISRSKTLCLAKSKTSFAARRSLLILTAVLFSLASFAQVNLNEGLVGYWSFDDGTAIDQSGNNHNGEIHGSVPFTDGDHGKYITFNGNYNNYIEVPHHDDLNFSNSFSVCTWVNMLSEPSSSFVISKGRDIYSTYYMRSGGRYFTFAYDDDYFGSDSDVSVSAEDFPINEWHHVSCVADNDNQVLNYYLDGQLMAQDSITGAYDITTTYPLVFGRHFTNSNGGSAWPYPCNSSIDEVRIYNRALNEEEVLELAGASAALGQITNVNAAQRTDGSKILDVTYDLSGSEAEYEVTLEVSFDAGENYELVNQVSGDVGMVAPGTGLQISWDAGTEFPEGFVNYTMKVMVLAIGQGSGTFTCGDDFTDTRDGQTYSTVLIGDQCWMAQNLAYLPEVSPSAEGSETDPYYYVYGYQGTDVAEAKARTNYETYGALYNWPASIDACPDGWHLPADAEWTGLTNYIRSRPEYLCNSNTSYIGKALAATTSWNTNPGICTIGNNLSANNTTGFTGLPGGYRNTYGSFDFRIRNGFWWSSSQSDTSNAWSRDLYSHGPDVYRNYYGKSSGLAVRCVKAIEQTNLPPTTPANPNPENEATGQLIESTLSWTCTDPENDPLTYDVYFGTEATPAQVATGQSETTFNPGTLDYNTQYFWKIVVHDDQGNTTEGEVWSFTTSEENFSPVKPSNPSPEDQSLYHLTNSTLSWSCTDPNGDPLTYDVYFGTDVTPAQVSTGQTETTFNPGMLEYNTQYFWKIVAHDNHSNTTEGDVWSFTTIQIRALLEIGDEYEGGIIAYILQPGDPGYSEETVKGFIATPNDYSTPVQWGCMGVTIGTSAALGAGQANTDSIIALCNQEGTAARICAELEWDGFTDWYLPSKDELNKLYLNKGLISGFSSEPHWCSTESSDIRGYMQYFTYGGFASYLKTFNYWVRPIRSFAYIDIGAPFSPSSPSPENGATGQLIETNLSWTCADPNGDPLTFDVYFGTEATPAQMATGQSETTFNPGTLEYNTQYFWKIVAQDDQGNTTEGEVWSFTTEEENLPPAAPSNPNPENEATDQPIESQLSWTCSDPENDPLTYDVFFGTEATPAQVATGQSETTFNPGTLEYNTQYFWKIVAQDDQGNTTEGEVWSLTTEASTIPTIGDEYGGGIIAYILEPGDPGYVESEINGLIAASGDQSTATMWGCNTINITGASGTALGTGYQNTLSIVAECNTAGIAAEICNDLVLNGYDDWYLPSKDELNKLYENRNLIGGFAADMYWCSSQLNTSLAWVHYFSNNNQHFNNKQYAWCRVRAVRSFSYSNSTPPELPSNPSPENGAIDQPTESTLSWTCTDPEGDALTYDVFFGTEAIPAQVATDQSETTFNPGTLEFNTQYFWKIVAHDDQGNTTEGEVWNFTIEEEPVGFTCGDNFTDARDGQSYSTLKIGNQCWMAENLNIGNMVNYNSSDNEIIEKYCYDNNLSNCDTYGGLYQWNEAMQYTSDQSIKGICPEGWHLPSNSEWTTLTNYVRTQPENLCNSSTSNIAKSMSSTTNWNNSSNTCAVGNNPLLNNSTGFSCLPAGNHSSGSGGSYYLKKNCYFWTSTQSYSGYANNIYIFNSSSNVSSYSYEKQYGLSVRCIQN